MGRRAREMDGYTRSDTNPDVQREDSRAAMSAAARVVAVFGLFAILWMVGVHPALDSTFGSWFDVRDALDFVGFVLLTGVLLFVALWSVTKEMVAAKRKLRESERELVRRLGQAAE